MDWLSLIVGSADVVLRRWSVLFDSVLGRYMDINVFKITSFSLFHYLKRAKDVPIALMRKLRESYKPVDRN